MLEPTDSANVSRPPLEEEVAVGAPVPLTKKKDAPRGRCARSSYLRSAAFFLSLFLCLTVVFAFSFIIPCPVRAHFLLTWNRTFPEAATYNFLAVADSNNDRVLDVLFVLKDTEGSLNTTCANESLPTPCVFLSAVSGTNGDTLWERLLSPEFHWAHCGFVGVGESNTGCLLSHADQLTAIEQSGKILWQQLQPPNLNCRLPVLTVPDLDGDDVGDVVLIGAASGQTKLAILSSKTGTQIGSDVVLDSAEASRHLLHTTGQGSHYVLFQTDSGLYGQALWKIAAQAQAGMERNLKKDQAWEEKATPTTGHVLLYESDSLQHVVRIAKGSKTSNLLLVTKDDIELIDGDGLHTLWRVNTSGVLSEPSLGHYNKDGTPDVIIEDDIGNGTKRVMILNGMSGQILWEVSLLFRPNTPRPLSVSTIKSYSVFIFWGEVPSETNSTLSTNEKQFSYMLHPHYSRVLLEKRNVMDRIIAFKATLLEKDRHACYITLMGPEGEGVEGTVTLTKRKLKEDIPESRVLRLGETRDEETDQEIKEAFNRLRFSKET